MDELRMVTPRAEAVEPCIGCERGEWHLLNTLLDTMWEDRGEISRGEAEAGSLRRELASSASRALPRFRRAVRRCGTCQSQLRLIATPVRSRLTLLGCNAANKMVSTAEDPRSSLLRPPAGGLLQPKFFPQPGDAKPQCSSSGSIPTRTARRIRSSSQSMRSSASVRVSGCS